MQVWGPEFKSPECSRAGCGSTCLWSQRLRTEMGIPRILQAASLSCAGWTARDPISNNVQGEDWHPSLPSDAHKFSVTFMSLGLLGMCTHRLKLCLIRYWWKCLYLAYPWVTNSSVGLWFVTFERTGNQKSVYCLLFGFNSPYIVETGQWSQGTWPGAAVTLGRRAVASPRWPWGHTQVRDNNGPLSTHDHGLASCLH